jgi:hypothetical protein
MISDETKAVINKHVDEYIDEMRFEFSILSTDREIQEIAKGEYIVRDSDFIFDKEIPRVKVLIHPLEDSFVPDKIEFYVTEFKLKLDSADPSNLLDFEVLGVVEEKSLFLWDKEISDDVIDSLIQCTFFDRLYQRSSPEVRTYLEGVYQEATKEVYQSYIGQILARLKPFLGL